MIFFEAINWNFDPDLFKLGSFPIKYYSLMYVLAFLVGLELMKRMYKKDEVSLQKLDALFIYAVISMLLGARIGHYLFYEENYTIAEVLLPFKLNPFEYTGFRGLASHGAILGMIIAMYFYAKRVIKKPLLWILDRMVIASAPGAAFVRLGNLFNSEIVGKPTGTDFGFKFIRHHYNEYEAMSVTSTQAADRAYGLIAKSSRFQEALAEVPNRYPTQLYEALGYLLVFVILWYVYRKTDKKKQVGFIFGLFMALFWAIRFFIEFYKESQGGIEEWVDIGIQLNTGQWLSIPLVLVGLFFMLRAKKKVA